MLFPGDRLFIPDKEPKAEPRVTDQRHRFRLKTQQLKLWIVVEDMYEKPVASAPFELQVEANLRNPMVVIRVQDVPHDEIPTVFIPILVRTAAPP